MYARRIRTADMVRVHGGRSQHDCGHGSSPWARAASELRTWSVSMYAGRITTSDTGRVHGQVPHPHCGRGPCPWTRGAARLRTPGLHACVLHGRTRTNRRAGMAIPPPERDGRAPRAAPRPPGIGRVARTPRRPRAGSVRGRRGCGGVKARGRDPATGSPDLRVFALGDSSLTLTWTAPGDDATTGRATRYDIRTSTLPLTDSSSTRRSRPTRSTFRMRSASGGTSMGYPATFLVGRTPPTEAAGRHGYLRHGGSCRGVVPVGWYGPGKNGLDIHPIGPAIRESSFSCGREAARPVSDGLRRGFGLEGCSVLLAGVGRVRPSGRRTSECALAGRVAECHNQHRLG